MCNDMMDTCNSRAERVETGNLRFGLERDARPHHFGPVRRTKRMGTDVQWLNVRETDCCAAPDATDSMLLQRCGWLAKARGVQCMCFLKTDAK